MGLYQEEMGGTFKNYLKFTPELRDPLIRLGKSIENIRKAWYTIMEDFDVPYEAINRFARDYTRLKRSVEMNIKKVIAFFSHGKLALYTAFGITLSFLKKSFDTYIETARETIQQTGILNKALIDQSLAFYRANIELARFGVFLRSHFILDVLLY